MHSSVANFPEQLRGLGGGRFDRVPVAAQLTGKCNGVQAPCDQLDTVRRARQRDGGVRLRQSGIQIGCIGVDQRVAERRLHFRSRITTCSGRSGRVGHQL